MSIYLNNPIDLSTKADLVGGFVPASQLPSYVDDVIEVANYASLPVTGEVSKIYITIDNNKQYRWSGSVYIELAFSGTTWSVVTTSQSALAGDYGYITNGAGLVTITLPVISTVGSSIQASTHNANGWHIAQNAGQTVYVGNLLTTTGIGGYLESTGIGDTIELVCVVANTDWRVVDMQGTITII